MAKFSQNRHSRRIRRICQNRRFVGTPISSSIALWRNFVKIAILAEFAGFVKIAASSVPLSQAQSLFGEISPKSPFSPNSPDSSKSPLRRYPYLELNRSLAKFRQNRHSRPNSPDSPKSPLRRYAYLELNRSLAKFRQNRHSRRIRRIRQNRRFVGTPISSSIALWRNLAKIAILAEFAGFVKIAASSVPLSRAQSLFGEISPKSPFASKFAGFAKIATSSVPLSRAQSLFGEISPKSPFSPKFAGFAKIATSSVPLSRAQSLFGEISPKSPFSPKFAGFAKIATSSVPLSRAQSLFGEISPKSPFSPNSPDSSKSPLRRYPYLELNRSLAKFRQNHHCRRIRRIRFYLWRNFVKIAKFSIACISGHISNMGVQTYHYGSRPRGKKERGLVLKLILGNIVSWFFWPQWAELRGGAPPLPSTPLASTPDLPLELEVRRASTLQYSV